MTFKPTGLPEDGTPNSTSTAGRTRRPDPGADLISTTDPRVVPVKNEITEPKLTLDQRIGKVISYLGRYYHSDAGDFQSRAQAEQTIRELQIIRESLQHSQKQWFASTLNGGFLEGSPGDGLFIHTREGIPGARHRVEGIHVDCSMDPQASITPGNIFVKLFAGVDSNLGVSLSSNIAKPQYHAVVTATGYPQPTQKVAQAFSAVALNSAAVKGSFTFPASAGKCISAGAAPTAGSSISAQTVLWFQRVSGGVTFTLGSLTLLTGNSVSGSFPAGSAIFPLSCIAGDKVQLNEVTNSAATGTADLQLSCEVDLGGGLYFDMTQPIDFGPGTGLTIQVQAITGSGLSRISAWGQTVSTESNR